MKIRRRERNKSTTEEVSSKLSNVLTPLGFKICDGGRYSCFIQQISYLIELVVKNGVDAKILV